MNNKKLENISKFLSFVLRHKPEELGISLDKDGWADVSILIEKANLHNYNLTLALLKEVVDTSDKKRFTLSENGQFIRAVQGHSTQSVQLVYDKKIPPDILCHGTAEKNLNSIKKQGILTKGRHYVHLSLDEKTALDVGKRYGKPVVIIVDAKKMNSDNYIFYQAENGVWLTNSIPAKYCVFPI